MIQLRFGQGLWCFSLSRDHEIHHDWFGQTAEETIMNISSIFGESGASFVIHHIL